MDVDAQAVETLGSGGELREEKGARRKEGWRFLLSKQLRQFFLRALLVTKAISKRPLDPLLNEEEYGVVEEPERTPGGVRRQDPRET